MSSGTESGAHGQIWWTFIPLLWNKRLREGVQADMTRHETPSAVVQFAPLTMEHVSPKVWAAAALLAVAFLGAGSLLLRSEDAPIAAERTVSYELLNAHQIVELVRTTILQHSDDKALSKQIADTLTQEDRLGDFQRVQTSEELASLLTKRVRQVSHDSRYQVFYSATPPDIAAAHGRSIYRITEHLSVALPSL
jgi:hypothetical protein